MSEAVKITIDDLTAAAAELRRLHAENEAVKVARDTMGNLWAKEKALNAELVEALHQIRAHTLYSPTGAVHLIARAALAKVEASK